MTSPATPPSPDDRDPVTSESPTQELRSCPTCGRTTGVGRYCENCGAEMPTAAQKADGVVVGDRTGEATARTEGERAGGAVVDLGAAGGEAPLGGAAPTAGSALSGVTSTTDDPAIGSPVPPPAEAPGTTGRDASVTSAQSPSVTETPAHETPVVETSVAETPSTGSTALGHGSPGSPAAPAATPDDPDAPVTPSTGDRPGATPGQAGMLVLGGLPTEVEDPTEPTPAPGDEPHCACGGTYADGYCEQCGSPLPAARAHTEDAPAPWVAGVCDIGIRHQSNQDAMALSAEPSRAALVVCDGVSSALRSEEASQAAADAAVVVLSHATSTGIGVPSSLVPALVARLETAGEAAADAVAAVTAQVHRELGIEGGREGEFHHANPSCTLVAAIVEAGHVVIGSVGDSRAYWFPDAGEARRLTVDDSWAEESIALGATREQAESGPGAHTITRWLGIDCDDDTPRTTSMTIEAPGWLILCSDGLWNYASEPAALAEVVADTLRGLPTDATSTAETDVADAARDRRVDSDPQAEVDAPAGTEAHPGTGAAAPAHGSPVTDAERPATGEAGVPLALARGLVQWANARGGHDNITVIAARLTPDAPTQEA